MKETLMLRNMKAAREAALRAGDVDALLALHRSIFGGYRMDSTASAEFLELADIEKLTLSQTVNRFKDNYDEIERLSAKTTLTPEDEKRFAGLVAESDMLDQHRKTLERTAEAERMKAIKEGLRGGTVKIEREGSTPSGYDRDVFTEPDSVEDRRFKNPWDVSEVRMFGRDKDEVRQELQSRALACIEKMPVATDAIREASTQIIQRWDDNEARISRLVLATSSPAYLRAFSKAARGKLESLSVEEQRALSEVRAMSLTDSAGGFLVPFQLDPTVIITANGSQNDIRQFAREVVATGDAWHGVSAAAVSWSWDAEATEVSDDSPSFAQPAIPVFTARGFVPISIEALEDEQNVAASVAELLAFGKDVLEAAAFATGSGTGQPTGIVTALTGGSSVVDSATVATFALGDIYALEGALPARYRKNAAWLANRAVYNKTRQFDTAGGAALWARLGENLPQGMLGRPIGEAEDMSSAISTTGSDVMVYGDFRNYVIADRIGMTVEFIPHLFGTTNGRPTGQRGWFAYYRTGADSVNDGAFRLLEIK